MYFSVFCFFFNDTSTTEIFTYLHTLSLHDALPICHIGKHYICLSAQHFLDLLVCTLVQKIELHDRTAGKLGHVAHINTDDTALLGPSSVERMGDRKSTRLNSSH